MFRTTFRDTALTLVAALMLSSVAVGSAVIPGVAQAAPVSAEIVTYA